MWCPKPVFNQIIRKASGFHDLVHRQIVTLPVIPETKALVFKRPAQFNYNSVSLVATKQGMRRLFPALPEYVIMSVRDVGETLG